MSDHQFEKNVQQKMDELRLRPSETVWQEVEKKIRARKRRRRGLIWIPLMAALFTGVFVYYSRLEAPVIENSEWSRNAKKTKVVEPSRNASLPDSKKPDAESLANNEDLSNTSEPSSIDPLPSGTDQIERESNTEIQKQERKNPPIIHATKRGENRENNTKHSDIGFKDIKPAGKGSDNTSNSYQRNNKTKNEDQLVVKNSYEKVKPANEVTERESNAESRSVAPPVFNADSVVKRDVSQNSKKTEGLNPEANNKMMAVPAPLERVRRKWQTGIAFHAGINKITTGSLLDFTEKSMVQDVAPSNFSMPVPRNAIIQKPSAITPGIAVQVRGFTKTEIRKRLHGSIGIGYGLYQTEIRVGQMVQSNQAVFTSNGVMDIQQYYQPEPNKVYTNRFHFIEIPVELEYRLNHKRKVPVAIHAGLSYSRLIGSNALQFDGSSRVYYKDNSVFNKNLAGMSGGVSVGILQSSRHPLSIGSSFHYRVTNLMHQNIYDRKHLLAAGMDVKMLLSKRDRHR